MEGMTRARVTLIAASALALAAWLGTAAPALPAGEEGPWADRAIVDVATPKLPDREEASVRWRALRSQSASELGDIASEQDLDVVARLPSSGQLVVDLGGESVGELRNRLRADPRVTRVVADGPAELRLDPDDPIFNSPDANAPAGDFAQWHLRSYSVQRAWDLSKGVGAEVAVIDSGIDPGHPDLAGRIAAQMTCEATCAAGAADDEVGHGTHVSGLACADSDGGYGLASIGFDCSIFAVKVVLTCSAVAAAIDAAGDRRSDAINLSLGGCSGGTLNASLAYAWNQGSVPVAAGANEPAPDPSLNYPAQYIQPEGTGSSLSQGRGLVVTSAKYDGSRSAFAQKTTGVSVAAHGSATDAVSGGQQGILSSWPASFPLPPQYDVDFATDPVRTTFFGDDRFAYLAGTSMASPQVAGLVALMRAAKPGLPNSKLIRLLKVSAGNCGKYKNGIGWGLIRADVAVGAAIGKDADAPSSRVLSAKRSRGTPGLVNLKLKRFDEGCSDELPSSGVKSVTVFVSKGGSTYRRFRKTANKKIRFRGKPGRRYRFFSVAVDKAGNKEEKPFSPDARVKLAKK